MADATRDHEEGAEGRAPDERRTEWAAERTEWAEERREWASLRTLLAKERTFTAWLRTGLAALVTGLAVLRFLADDGRSLPATLLGVLLVATSAALFGLAFWSYRKALGELAEKGVRGLPTWILAAVTATLLLGSLIGLAVLL